MRRASQMLLAALMLAVAACASVPALDDMRLAGELHRRPIVLLGEVHDNHQQHQMRLRALTRFVESGARPAIAFEQFDRDRQPDLDRARREAPPAGRSLAQHVIDVARTPRDGWDWDQYRPYVELALHYDLPIVAANLSRAAAGAVARTGYSAEFSEQQVHALALDRVDAGLLRQQEQIAAAGHCNLLPPAALPGLAHAQLARDAVLAQSIRPYEAAGVILLTGNGHARRDIGIPRHMSAAERSRTWSIGLLEAPNEDAEAYDVAFVSARQAREDPCLRVLPRTR